MELKGKYLVLLLDKHINISYFMQKRFFLVLVQDLFLGKN